jgi:hypothetical protein
MLMVGVAALIAAQLLGIVGLVRPGYEVLTSLAMLILFLPPFVMVVLIALSL